MDETGIPVAGRGAWRVYKAEEYIARAKAQVKRGISTVLVGIIPPFEVIEYRTYDKGLNLHFALLKITPSLFETRMQARLKKQKATHDYPEHKFENLRLAGRLESQIASLKNGHSIDATSLSKTAVVAQVKALIQSL